MPQFPVGGRVGTGGGGSISASLGAQAFLRRRDAAGDTQGVLAYFGPVAAGEQAIAGLGPAGNAWSVISRERDPGLSAVVSSVTYVSVAFGDSALQDTPIDGLPISWVGTRTAQVGAGDEGIAAGIRNLYYLNLAGSQHFRWWTAVSGGGVDTFSLLEDVLQNDVTWAHVYSDFNADIDGTGRFANDAAVLAYIQANRAYFQGRDAEDPRTLRVAYFNTTSNTVRIGEVIFIEGVQGRAAEALAVRVHEDDQIIELRYASEATALSPVTRADNVGEILAAFNTLNDRGLYAQAAGGAADAAAFSRDPGFLLDPEGLVSTFIPRRDAEDSEGIDVWLYPVGSLYLNTNSPLVSGQAIRVFSGVGDTTPLPGVTSVTVNTVLTALRLRYDPATATIAQIVSALNAHNASGLNAAVREGTNAGSDFNRVQPWSHDFALSDFAPDAWEEDFGGGEDIELDSAFYAMGPPQSVFTGATEAAAETARNNYATANPGWKATYQADQRLFVLVRWGNEGNEKATVLLADGVTWREIAFAFVGRQGPIGLPGGGAIEPTGIVLDLRSVAIATGVHRATGFMLGERANTPICLYRLEEGATSLLWFQTDPLYDLVRVSAGDASVTTLATRNSLLMPESAGSSLSGSVRAGLTADNELTLVFSSDDADTYIEFFRQVPSAAQSGGGLSDADRQELTRLSGVETDATQDQTAGEIAILLDGLIGNAAWRTRLSGADLVAAVDAAVGNAIWRSAHTVQRTAQQIVDLLDVALGGDSWRTGGGGGGGLTVGAATDAAGALLATLSQFTYNEADDTLTFVPSPPHMQVVRTPDSMLVSGAGVAGGPFGTAAVMPIADSTALGVMSRAQASKLAGIAPAANRLIPYKIGNIYRAFAAGANIVKPGNTEGTVTIAGITVAPVGWRLTRPETTAALPHVYDCHVYGYETNGVFGVQYGTPNRTDRYIAPGGTGIDVSTANGLIQDALAAAVMGNTETGITVTHNADGTIDFVVSGGGTPTPVTDDVYFGTSANDFASAGELTIPGVNGSGVIPAYAGHRHHLIARLATEGDITSVLYSDDPTMANAIGAYIKFGNTLVPPGETEPFTVWITEQALLQAADVTVTVS